MSELYRQLPKVDMLVADPSLSGVPRGVAVGACRQVLDELRAEIAAGLQQLPDVIERVVLRATLLDRGRLRPVINATGIVVHTNLGRAPWSDSARAAASAAMAYCNLEMDLQTGQRGGRLHGVQVLLQHLTGAESALVVNNCAAAVLLALTALARGREVVVSRGELVEIGGSFRVPDVIASGGAVLREVGTTNRTRVSDYADAIGPETAVLLRVHPSNYRVVGFTEEPSREGLVALGRAHGLPVIEDVGAGSLQGGFGEVSVREVVASGVDLALFSGDKLLGGPQAGVVVGRREVVGRLRCHSLYRALRVGKVTLAALEATLADHAAGRPVPVGSALEVNAAIIAARARALVAALAQVGVEARTEPSTSFVGGGALPGQGLPTVAVVVPCGRPDRVATVLRTGRPAAVARVHDGALWCDPRTLRDDQLEALAGRVADSVAAE